MTLYSKSYGINYLDIWVYKDNKSVLAFKQWGWGVYGKEKVKMKKVFHIYMVL